MTFLTESVAILNVKLVDIVRIAVSLSQKVCLQRVRLRLLFTFVNSLIN